MRLAGCPARSVNETGHGWLLNEARWTSTRLPGPYALVYAAGYIRGVSATPAAESIATIPNVSDKVFIDVVYKFLEGLTEEPRQSIPPTAAVALALSAKWSSQRILQKH
jgi:hypothetical protein